MSPQQRLDVLGGGGEMGDLARAIEWQRSPLGPVDGWPQSLRTSISVVFEAKFPMLLCWGGDFIQFYNDAFRPILGATKHPAFGKRAADTYQEAWHIVGPLFDQVMRGQAVGFEDMLVPLDRNGYLEECYFHYSYSPVRSESGEIGGLIVTCMETTGRVVAERRLRTLRDLALQAAQEQQETAAWQGAAGVLQSNAADLPFFALYVIDEDARTASVAATSAPALAPAMEADGDSSDRWPVFEAIASGPQLVTDVRRRFGDHAGAAWPEYVEAALVLPIARPGAACPYGVVVAGISPRQSLDGGYRDFLTLVADQLATTIGHARAFNQERHRTRSAEGANRAKDEFLAMLSHELRNPLAPIVTALQLMALRGDRGAEKERAMIERQVRHVVRLVDDLLDVSRIARGKIELRPERIEIAAIVAKAVEMASPIIEQKQHRLELHVDSHGLTIEGDPMRLEQIVFNLLYNAAKYTDARGKITLSASAIGDRVELRVRDNGIGIDAEMVPQLFELFTQDRRGQEQSRGGLGLGLAIVRNLVELHGGTVCVSSGGRGAGSEFVVTLPATLPGRALLLP